MPSRGRSYGAARGRTELSSLTRPKKWLAVAGDRRLMTGFVCNSKNQRGKKCRKADANLRFRLESTVGHSQLMIEINWEVLEGPTRSSLSKSLRRRGLSFFRLRTVLGPGHPFVTTGCRWVSLNSGLWP